MKKKSVQYIGRRKFPELSAFSETIVDPIYAEAN